MLTLSQERFEFSKIDKTDKTYQTISAEYFQTFQTIPNPTYEYVVVYELCT